MRLYNADCFDVLESLEDNSVDAVITDPPYATTGKSWDTTFDLDKWWEQINRVLKDDGVAIVFADEPFSSQLVVSNIQHFRYEWIWNKSFPSGALQAWKRPLKNTEDIYVFSKKTPRYNIKQFLTPCYKTSSSPRGNRLQDNDEARKPTEWTGFPTEVISFAPVRVPRTETKLHIAQKPVELMGWLVKLYTQEGDVVLDPFMGSGSTGVACKKLGRDFIGVELYPDYYQIAGERLA
jgi:DNA modification methylase